MDGRDPCLVDFQGLIDHAGIAQRCLDARLQLAGRLLGEGDGKNLIDIVHIAASQSIHDAFSKREGLSRACTGSYDQRLIERVDAFQLTGFESHSYAPRFAQEKSGQKRQASLVDGLA